MARPQPTGVIQRPWVRIALCAVVLPLIVVAIMGGLSVYLPLDQADRIMLPLLLFPLLYLAGIFVLLMTQHLLRDVLILFGLGALNAGLVALSFW